MVCKEWRSFLYAETASFFLLLSRFDDQHQWMSPGGHHRDHRNQSSLVVALDSELPVLLVLVSVVAGSEFLPLEAAAGFLE